METFPLDLTDTEHARTTGNRPKLSNLKVVIHIPQPASRVPPPI